MRTEVIRIYKTVHTWAGILTGLVLFIAFYAGAITVFKEPLERWIAPPNHSIRAPLTQMHELITQTLSARPDAGKEFTLHLGDEEHVPARLTWQKKNRWRCFLVYGDCSGRFLADCPDSSFRAGPVRGYDSPYRGHSR